MGRMHAFVLTPTAVTAAVDIAELLAGSAKPFVIHSIYIGQQTEVGDAQDEQLTYAIKSGQTTSGSGGTALGAAAALDTGNTVAAATTGEQFNTTKASAGTIVTHHQDTFNVRAGLQYRPTPEERITIAAGRRCTLELVAAPADSITITGTIIIEEIG